MLCIEDEKHYTFKGKELKELCKGHVVETINELGQMGILEVKNKELPPLITIKEALKLLKKKGYDYTRTTIVRWIEAMPELKAPNGMGGKIFLYSDKLKEYVETGTIKRKKQPDVSTGA
jgi:hypothetical protein